MKSYNLYNPNNYVHYQEGDLIIAQAREKNVSNRILKGIVIEGDRYTDSGNIVTVKRCGYERIYTIPVNLIIVHVSSIYPRFDEFKAEILSMSSEDGKDYEHLYDTYKIIDNAEDRIRYSEQQLDEHKKTISNLEKSISDLESVVYKINGDLKSSNSAVYDNGCVRIDDSVFYNRIDVLEKKHKKTEKLLKLGVSILLGGI